MERYSEGFGFILTFGLLTFLSLNLVPKLCGGKFGCEATMEKFGKSQSVLRREENRFLNGTGKYIDDQTPSSSLFAYFFRSQVAHAKIKDLNVETARKNVQSEWGKNYWDGVLAYLLRQANKLN